MNPLNLLSKVTATVWLLIALGLAAIAGVQTWRLKTVEVDLARHEAAAATDTAKRATAYAADSDKTAGREQTHAAATQKASDAFTQAEPQRVLDLAADIARARGLLDSAVDRAARYRAQANVDAAACSRLADRSAALDRGLAEGLGVVAELKGALERRDAEVALQGSVIDADHDLLSADH